ncbi:MAG TPA: adenosylcobinamide amidohydrolase [Candidatus Binataceae bacterium]
MDRSIPWRWEVRDRTLIVRFDTPFRTLGWAPMGGGFSRARVVANHQVSADDSGATEAPLRYLRRTIRHLAIDPRGVVAMMTGANVGQAAYAFASRGSLVAGAWCTAGCTNALRVGDRATFASAAPGTINLIVALNEPFDDSALTEAVQITTEARVVAVQGAKVASTRSGKPATGTGTDCLVVATPVGKDAHRYCGKHTVAGELIGRAVLASCARALVREARNR